MIENCTLEPRVAATTVVSLDLFIVLVLSQVARRSQTTPCSLWRTIIDYRWRLLMTPFFVIIYGALLLSLADLLNAAQLAPPDKSRCLIEIWWMRNTVYSIGMMVWMFFVALPFLQRSYWNTAPSTGFKLASAVGILVRIAALAVLARAIVTHQYQFHRAISWITILVLPFLAWILRRRPLYARFKSGSLAAFIGLWPSLLIPTPTPFAISLTAVLTVTMAVLIHITLGPRQQLGESPLQSLALPDR